MGKVELRVRPTAIVYERPRGLKPAARGGSGRTLNRLGRRGGVRHGRALPAALCFCLLYSAGCGLKEEAAVEGEQPRGLTERASGGDVTLTVSTDRSRVRVSEPLRLIVEVRAPADVEVELPEVPEVLEDFVVRDRGELEVIEGEEGRVWRQTFVIDSNLSGRRQIPGLSVTVGEDDVVIATAPLSVEVISAVEGEGELDPTQFADIQGPVAVPKPRSWLAVYVGVGMVLALALLVWLLLRRRSASGAAAAPPPPPHVWALEQLDDLLAEKLIERGMVHEFYYRLSGIVRTYIELRFGLMAPERTTEEFLIEARHSGALGWGHKDLLGEFLGACDLVKFARHEPRGAEMDASMQTARRFISETAPASATGLREAAA